MINTDRIVPVQKIDLLTLWSGVLSIANVSAIKLGSTGIGEFSQTTNSATVICNEPVKSLNFGSSVTAANVYFIADADYQGFTKTGATLTVTGDVAADGVTLYKATLSTNALTISAVTM